MLPSYGLYLELLIIVSLIFAQIFDVYATMIRAKVNVEGSTQVLGVANWVQYIARIMNMLSVFSISFLLEKKIATIGVPALFMYSMIASLVAAFVVAKLKFVAPIMRFLQLIGFAGVFGVTGRQKYWWKINFIYFSRVTFFSAVVALLINSALIIPFVLSVRYPDFRMTLAYTGQLFNFLASIIAFTYLDRIFFRALDEGNEFICASQIITGKLLSLAVLFLYLVFTLG